MKQDTTVASMSPAMWFERHASRRPPLVRLFCIPHAGGSGYPYRTWMPHLPDGVELCGIRLPGRGPRIMETAFHRMDPLIAVLSDVIVEYLDLPFVLFGHSMGALIAYELCTQLSQRGFQAAHLFVSATRAPHVARGEMQLHLLPQEDFLGKLREFNGTALEILDDEVMIANFLPLLRADFELVETYPQRVRPALSCPITALGGRGDPTVSQEELQEWSQYTKRSFRRFMFPGDHFFIFPEQAPVLRLVSETIRAL